MTHRLAREIEWNARIGSRGIFSGVARNRNPERFGILSQMDLRSRFPGTAGVPRRAGRIDAIACEIIQIEERWISKVSLVILDAGREDRRGFITWLISYGPIVSSEREERTIELRKSETIPSEEDVELKCWRELKRV